MSNIQFEEKTYNTDSLDIGLWKKILSLLGRSKKHLIALAVLRIEKYGNILKVILKILLVSDSLCFHFFLINVIGN